MRMTQKSNNNEPGSGIPMQQFHKIRRKSTDSSTSTPPPPTLHASVLPSSDSLSDSKNNNAAFGQQLLLALSKAHAVATFDYNWFIRRRILTDCRLLMVITFAPFDWNPRDPSCIRIQYNNNCTFSQSWFLDLLKPLSRLISCCQVRIDPRHAF